MRIVMNIDEFFNWLASHSDGDIVGLPGRSFHSPLAQFLYWKSGQVVGEDGRKYGRASAPVHLWLDMPQWAQRFSSLSERMLGRALSAYEAVCLLIEVEASISSLLAA